MRHPVPLSSSVDPREIPRKLCLNQQTLWAEIGVTQRGGSTYESGRSMPKPIREMLRLVPVEKVAVKNLKHDDMTVLEFLKNNELELQKALKKAA